MKISVYAGGSDAKLFMAVINQGIDAHLEAFTKSKFKIEGHRIYMDFDESEIKILTRRLREMDTEEAEMWACDIEEAAANEQVED